MNVIKNMEIKSVGTKKSVSINGEDISDKVNRVFVSLDPNGLPVVHLICNPTELNVTADDTSVISHDCVLPFNEEPLTCKEMIRMPIHSDVFVQMKYNNGFVFAATYVGHGMNIDFYHAELPVEKYGKDYVCWRKRPTEEQVAGVKWDE